MTSCNKTFYYSIDLFTDVNNPLFEESVDKIIIIIIKFDKFWANVDFII